MNELNGYHNTQKGGTFSNEHAASVNKQKFSVNLAERNKGSVLSVKDRCNLEFENYFSGRLFTDRKIFNLCVDGLLTHVQSSTLDIINPEILNDNILFEIEVNGRVFYTTEKNFLNVIANTYGKSIADTINLMNTIIATPKKEDNKVKLPGTKRGNKKVKEAIHV